MNTATTPLHDSKLEALCRLPANLVSRADVERIQDIAQLCGRHYDTRNLSDKSLEEIDVLSGKYLDRVR